MTIPDASFQNKKVFVSRHLSTISPILVTLNSLGCEVLHESLIKFSKVRFTHTPSTQWVFFSSKNSMDFFFQQDPQLHPLTKFAVMSESSAEHLLQYGKNAHFIGQGVDVIRIAKDFAALIKDETVLFPQAIDSLQTVQKQLSFTNTCYNLFVYKTSLRNDFEIPSCDILVFTSPSNVQAYFEKYKFLPGQEVIAIGSTTLSRIRFYGVKEISLSSSFNEKGLLDAILAKSTAKVFK